MDIPKDLLSKEFLSQFKTAEDVDSFLKKLHAKVYEGMLEGEMENLWVMRRTQLKGNTAVTPVMVNTLKRSKPNTVNPPLRYLVIAVEILSL